MIDKKKRNTLKTLAISAGAIAGGSLAMNATAFGAAIPADTRSISVEELELGNIDVYTRVSVANNDLEVVLTNAGKQPVTITQMTPSVTRVARGEFDFSAIVKNGPRRINVGESVTIPLKRKALDYHATSVASLKETLQKSMSIVTEGNSYASVSVIDKGIFG